MTLKIINNNQKILLNKKIIHWFSWHFWPRRRHVWLLNEEGQRETHALLHSNFIWNAIVSVTATSRTGEHTQKCNLCVCLLDEKNIWKHFHILENICITNDLSHPPLVYKNKVFDQIVQSYQYSKPVFVFLLIMVGLISK